MGSRSRDPIGYVSGRLSLFEYVSSRPTSVVDPLGLQGWEPFLPPYESPPSPPDQQSFLFIPASQALTTSPTMVNLELAMVFMSFLQNYHPAVRFR